MLQEATVTYLPNHRLRETNGVRHGNGAVSAIDTEDGATYSAKVFADCTYEGDLMAQAGVSYTWGREGAAEYFESLAGVRSETPKHQFLVDLPPYAADHRLPPKSPPRRAPPAPQTAKPRPTTSASSSRAAPPTRSNTPTQRT